ncbi:MAG: DUF6263 family protein [Bacteroidota bacterium]
MKHILSLCALVAIFVTTASAQAVYDRTPGKSLQYSITSEVATTAVAPQGEQVIDVEGDGLITVTFAEADTVRAMYDKYDLAVDMAGNEEAMDLLTMMTGDFTMTMSDNGTVEVLTTPTLSAPMNLPGGNIAQQFDSFFLELPEDDLTEGTTWTTTKETMMQEGVTSTVETTYTVQGTTTKAGMDVLVINVDATTEVDGETEQQGMAVIINLKGTLTGEYYYAVEEGIMVGSEISQDVSGGQDMEGGGQSVAIDIDITGTNTTMLVTE